MPGSFGSVAVQAVVVAAGLMAFGFLLADAALGRRSVSAMVRWALALPALLAWVFLLMVLHLATGGRVFSNLWLVRGLTAAAAVGLATLKVVGGGRTPSGRSVALAAAVTVAVGLLVWGSPVGRIVPLAPPRSDFDWHMGWAGQLLNGETSPSSILTGEVPNYYPWMFQALAAFASAFTPGGRPYFTLPPLQLVQVSGTLLALFAIGREIGRSWTSGAGAALFGGLTGGFGYFLVRGITLVTNPRGPGVLTYHGDFMFLRSYNAAFQNLSPPFPRDVAFGLLLAYVLLLMLGFSRNDPAMLVGAGCCLGLVGLTGGESFIVGVGVAVLVTLLPPGLRRGVVAPALFAPAAVVYAVWLVPLGVSYAQLGGFVNTTIGAPVRLPLSAVLLSWGLTTPVALYGAVRWLPRHVTDPAARVVWAILVAAVGILLGASLVSLVLGKGFSVLARQQRYWPIVGLGVALIAAVGMADLLSRLWVWRRWPAVAVGVLAVALAIPSSVVASLAIPSHMRPAPLVGAAMLGRPSSLLATVAEAGRRRCVVAGPPTLVLTIFGYTGYRFVAVRTFGQPRNFARIRWRDVYRRITPEAERVADNALLTGGAIDPENVQRLTRKYGVDLLIVPSDRAGTPAYRGLPRAGSRLEGGFDVLRTGACD
jgi:hypothetical protein